MLGRLLGLRLSWLMDVFMDDRGVGNGLVVDDECVLQHLQSIRDIGHIGMGDGEDLPPLRLGRPSSS